MVFKKKSKEQKAQVRLKKEQEMAEYLRGKGWQQCGPLGDVWKTVNWKSGSEFVVLSLTHAYQAQVKLDHSGVERPANLDDDLAAKI